MPEATKNVLPGIFACYKKNDSLFAHPHALPPKHQYEHLFFFFWSFQHMNTHNLTNLHLQPFSPTLKDKKKEKQNKTKKPIKCLKEFHKN